MQAPEDFNEEDLPILGEPLSIELANTSYGESADFIDFLGSRELAAVWLSAAFRRVLAQPSRVSHQQLLRVRDALHQILKAVVADAVPTPDAVQVVSEAARTSSKHRRLSWTPEGARWIANDPASPDGVLGALFAEAADFLCGPALARVQRCEGADCTMFFVKNHHRRRFCHHSCSQRARQAAYYRRNRDRQ